MSETVGQMPPVVAITTGLRKKLTREELQGVLAHEIAHIRNFDTRLMLLLAVLLGTITMLADFFCTETPNWVTAWGNCGSARFTRFCTCTCAMSGSMSSVK